MAEYCMNVFYTIVISHAHSYRTAFQSAQLSMNQRSAVQTAPYGNVMFVEIVAYICRGVVLEIERHHAGCLGGIKPYVLDLFKTVEQFSRQITRVERDFGKVLIRPFRACAQADNSRAVDGAGLVRFGRNGRLG